jgi:TonB family protein
MIVATFYSEGVYRVGGGVSVPRLLTTQEPEYTAEARAARIEGSVGLIVTIGQDGIARDIRVEKSLGYGLDEKAIECVCKWRFSPGVMNGEPVPVAANISVGFSLQGGTQHPRGVQNPTRQIEGA